ncbi:MAG: Asp-tRNA(Asn)/Glu-tRNA(Gln) amidotransferase subunit GatA [Flavisolibacter sp.]
MFSFSSIEDYHARLNKGEQTCVQAVSHYLSAIEKNKRLNSFLEVYSDEALQRASELDEQTTKGELHGVVIGLKDNICYKNHRASAGSRILENYTSVYSATAVDRLVKEGAIIIGRQNCDEFGMGSTNENSAYGPVLNPSNEEHVAGGSSGGSAAAVKAALCMAALGSDTGGSVRLPADFTGVVGFKPNYGRISRHGLIAYGSSFDQIGILANNITDTAKILRVIAGPDSFDSTAIQSALTENFSATDSKKYRIAYFPEWIDHPSIDPEISGKIKKLIETLREQGHTLEPVHFELTEYIVPTYYILTTAEASSNLSRYDGVRYGPKNVKAENLTNFYQQNRTDGFGKEVKRRIMLGSFVLSTGYYEAYFTKAQQTRQLLKAKTELIFKDFDFIIAPNSPTIAYRLGAVDHDPLMMYMGDIFTVFANLVGIPAISLPLFKHSSNLPFGLQVLSSPHNEVSLLRFSHRLMQQ